MRLIDADALKIITVTHYNRELGDVCDHRYVRAKDVEAAPAVAAAPQWISVQDRLPDVDSFLGISRFNNKVRIYDVRTWEPGWVVGGLKIAKDITHWMPLPQPPKMDTES